MHVWISRIAAAALLAVLTSCGPDDSSSAVAEEEASLNLGPEVNQQLAQLRRTVAPFHDFERAVEAGWSTQLTPCLELPGVGAMGFHYGNPALIDGEATVLEPELLVYEPQKNGRLRLVAVEYIIPFSILGSDQPAPVVAGLDMEMHPNLQAGLWALHVWIGRHNPAGMFADWNPKVTCAFAP